MICVFVLCFFLLLHFSSSINCNCFSCIDVKWMCVFEFYAILCVHYALYWRWLNNDTPANHSWNSINFVFFLWVSEHYTSFPSWHFDACRSRKFTMVQRRKKIKLKNWIDTHCIFSIRFILSFAKCFFRWILIVSRIDANKNSLNQ